MPRARVMISPPANQRSPRDPGQPQGEVILASPSCAQVVAALWSLFWELPRRIPDSGKAQPSSILNRSSAPACLSNLLPVPAVVRLGRGPLQDLICRRTLLPAQRHPQPLIRCLQQLRQHAGFADDGHEIGVGHPARQGVHVDVAGNACTGGLADVHADVQTVGMVELVERSPVGGPAPSSRSRAFRRQLVQAVYMLVGDDHGCGRRCRERR